jgi:hypothetical protein
MSQVGHFLMPTSATRQLVLMSALASASMQMLALVQGPALALQLLCLIPFLAQGSVHSL